MVCAFQNSKNNYPVNADQQIRTYFLFFQVSLVIESYSNQIHSSQWASIIQQQCQWQIPDSPRGDP